MKNPPLEKTSVCPAPSRPSVAPEPSTALVTAGVAPTASILLIDDDAAVLPVYAEFLRQAGYAVATALDGTSGLALYRAGRHDLVVTDIVMPHVEGLALIQSLQRMVPRPRIIAISGSSAFSRQCYLPTAKFFGAQRTLEKPISRAGLLQAVAEVLAAPLPPTTSAPAART